MSSHSGDQFHPLYIYRRVYIFDLIKNLIKKKHLSNKLIDVELEPLLPHAAKLIGINSKELRRRLTKVHIITDSQVQCFVRTMDRKTFEIGINDGFIGFLGVMAAVLLTRAVIEGDGHPTIPFEEILPIADEFMRGYWAEEIIYHPGLAAIQLNDIQDKLYSAVLGESIGFALAHELGHIVIELSSARKADEYKKGVEIVKKFLADTYQHDGIIMGPIDMDKLEQHWADEIGADLIGLKLLLILIRILW